MKALRLLIVAVLGFAAFAVFAAWAFYEGARVGGGWEALLPVLPYVIGGLMAVGALTGVLMWLAFFSSRRGYDEPYDVDAPLPPRRRR